MRIEVDAFEMTGLMLMAAGVIGTSAAGIQLATSPVPLALAISGCALWSFGFARSA